jgi:hypothetical protein
MPQRHPPIGDPTLRCSCDRQAGVPQERVGQVRSAAHTLDARCAWSITSAKLLAVRSASSTALRLDHRPSTGCIDPVRHQPGSGARAVCRPGSSPPALPAQHDDGKQPGLDLAISWLPARAAAALQLPDEEAPRQRHPPARRRNAALRELVLEMPPRIVADALGHSAQVTEKHAEDAGRTWVTYAPYRSRRGSIGGEPDTIQR